jgi:hypothetical protein
MLVVFQMTILLCYAVTMASTHGETCSLASRRGLSLHNQPPPHTCEASVVPGVEYCAVAKHCGVVSQPNMSEVERWQCVGDFMYAPLPRGQFYDDPYFVEHNCYGTGWGNSVRALFTTASLAAALGRRLIVRNHAFNRMFSPPHPNVTDWYGGGVGRGAKDGEGWRDLVSL